MGIKGLNKLLKERCSKGITKVYLNKLQNTCIAIDTSIFLYKYSYFGEKGQKANPFCGREEISHGDYIYKNIMAEQLIKLIMMPFI